MMKLCLLTGDLLIVMFLVETTWHYRQTLGGREFDAQNNV